MEVGELIGSLEILVGAVAPPLETAKELRQLFAGSHDLLIEEDSQEIQGGNDSDQLTPPGDQ